MKHLLFFLIASLIFSCKTASREPYWETNCRIRNNGTIWVPLNISGKEYSSFFDFCASSSFPANLLSIYQLDTIQYKKTNLKYKLITERSYSEVHKTPPLHFELGSKQFKNEFIILQDTFVTIGTDFIHQHSWHFNLKESTLKLSNQKIEMKKVSRKPYFKAKIRFFQKRYPSSFMPISWNHGAIIYDQLFLLDTGCSIKHTDRQGCTSLMDVAILVNNLDHFYSRKSPLREICKSTQPDSIYKPFRMDYYPVETVTLNGLEYSNFNIVVVELPYSINVNEEIWLLGMGFYSRFSNLYIDKKQVILYNEDKKQ